MKSIKYHGVDLFRVLLCCFILLVTSNYAQAANEDVQNIQQKLTDLGYQPGKADGLFGMKTRKALLKYQDDNNLPTTGRIDKVTAKALGVEVYVPSKDELFNSLNSSLVNFLNKLPSGITGVCGKNSKYVSYPPGGRDVSYGLLSGGYSILGGRMIPDRGSKIVISILSDKCKVLAIAGKDGKVSKVEKVTFKAGAQIRFSGGWNYIFNGTAWNESH